MLKTLTRTSSSVQQKLVENFDKSGEIPIQDLKEQCHEDFAVLGQFCENNT